MKQILTAILILAAGVGISSTPLVQGELNISSYTEQTEGARYRVVGEFRDLSVAGFDGTDIAISNLVFTETVLGHCDVWKITNVVNAGAVKMTVDVEYVESGSSTVGMVAGYAALASLSTNSVGFPQPPSSEFCHLSANLLSQIRNYSFQRIIDTIFDDTALKGATNTLNLQVASLTGWTNSVISATNYLNNNVSSLIDWTNAVIGATNSLNSSVGLLNSATSILNTATGSLSARIDGVTNGAALGVLYQGTITSASIVTGAVAGVTTNGGSLDFTVPSGGGSAYDDTALVAATGALNTAVGNLNEATNNLSGRVATIEGQPTNLWAVSGATNVTPGSSYAYNPTTRSITVNSNDFGGGGSADLSAWSTYSATQPVTWNEVITNIYAGGPTNLLVTGWLTPDVTGMYTQREDVAGAPSYHNANGYDIYRIWQVEMYYYYLGTDTNGSCLFLTINDDPTSANWGPNTGSAGNPAISYFYNGLTNVITNVWTFGLDASGGCMQKTRNGVVIQRWYANSNVVSGVSYASDFRGPWYGLGTNAFYPYSANPAGYLTSMTLGITSGSAYDGAQGNYVSNLATMANANNILTSNAIPTTAAQVQAYPNPSGIAASNLAYTAGTNAEAARVIGTNALAKADAALPKNFTNNPVFPNLQITDPNTTNGAVLQCTNTATGQMGLVYRPSGRAWTTANVNYIANSYQTVAMDASELFGTSMSGQGVLLNKIGRWVLSGRFWRRTGSAGRVQVYFFINNSNVLQLMNIAPGAQENNYSDVGVRHYNNLSATNVFFLAIYPAGLATTNEAAESATFIQAEYIGP